MMNAVVLAWLAVCIIWRSTWLFSKLGLRDLPPLIELKALPKTAAEAVHVS